MFEDLRTSEDISWALDKIFDETELSGTQRCLIDIPDGMSVYQIQLE